MGLGGQAFGKDGGSQLLVLDVQEVLVLIRTAVSNQYRMAAMCEQVSAKPAMQVQCPHSTLPFFRMATQGCNGCLLAAYECLTFPTSRKMSL